MSNHPAKEDVTRWAREIGHENVAAWQRSGRRFYSANRTCWGGDVAGEAERAAGEVRRDPRRRAGSARGVSSQRRRSGARGSPQSREDRRGVQRSAHRARTGTFDVNVIDVIAATAPRKFRGVEVHSALAANSRHPCAQVCLVLEEVQMLSAADGMPCHDDRENDLGCGVQLASVAMRAIVTVDPKLNKDWTKVSLDDDPQKLTEFLKLVQSDFNRFRLRR
jgi:hypothetical protein